jgi:hypothetical protein
MRVSLLLLRDLSWMALLLLFVVLTVVALAATQEHGEKTGQDR